jgi:hypothetical protein
MGLIFPSSSWEQQDVEDRSVALASIIHDVTELPIIPA